MIKTKPPRPKPAKGGDSGPDGGADKSLKHSGGGGGSGGGSGAKKRRPSQKKKETADDGGGGGGSRKRSIGGVVLAPPSSSTLHQEEHRRYYQRAPRLLPDIDGVRALSSSEVSADLKLLQSSLNAFEAKLAGHLPSSVPALGGGLYLHGNKATPPTPSSMEDAYAFLLHQPSMKHRRLARPNGVITPEEVVESLPACRRAVRITQRELAAMKRERDDLERDFMRQRNKLLWQMGEMKRIQKQHDRSLQVLSADVLTTAKSLASSRRRTNALQDIMTELDARGNAVVRLTRDKHQLEALLQKHGIPLPEPDEIYVGDRVSGPFGEGRVTAMDDVQRVLTVALDHGKGTAYVQEETVEVLPSEISYADAEKELKAKLFDTIGALVQPHGRFSFLSAASGRRRSRDDQDSDGDLVLDGLGHADADEDDEDEEEEEEEDATENGLGDGDDEQYAGRRSAAEGDLDGINDETEMSRKRPAKKRKLMVPPADKKKKKLQKHSKILDFTAGKIPITPYDVGLLLSPLSVLPERVAAVGPDALQWLSSYLPAKMADWEQDRYHSLQMQGEIERLRFELQKAEDDKEDAHSLAVEQVDSMNDLVRQIEKLREQLAAKELKEKGSNQTCATCSTPSTGSSSKKASATTKQTKSNGRASGSKSSNRRPRSESTEGDDDDADSSGKEDKKKTAHDESDAPEDSDGRKDKGDAHQQEDDDYGDDGGESSGDASKPAARSLRPRRGSGNSTTSQSSATTSTSKAAK